MAEQPNAPEPDSESEELLGLEGFAQPDDDGGLSLEALSAAYAEMIDGGSVPYDRPDGEAPEMQAGGTTDDEPDTSDSDTDCEISPRSILEAMLFVGNSANEPLSSKQVAALMRGVRQREIDQLVVELNDEYRQLGCPYSITSVGTGFLLELDEDYRGLREKFYRRTREARLSQAAVDVLAIVAYRQPLNRDEIDKLRGRPSSSVLAQLVRRQLLCQNRSDDNPRKPNYQTTERFLQLFGLRSLEELPQSQEIDADF